MILLAVLLLTLVLGCRAEAKVEETRRAWLAEAIREMRTEAASSLLNNENLHKGSTTYKVSPSPPDGHGPRVNVWQYE